jgi:hypothetical protein
MRCSLRTLFILLAIGPVVGAGAYERWRDYVLREQWKQAVRAAKFRFFRPPREPTILNNFALWMQYFMQLAHQV